jgi:hypothetical protein
VTVLVKPSKASAEEDSDFAERLAKLCGGGGVGIVMLSLEMKYIYIVQENYANLN